VDANGIATARAAGPATITATSEGKSGTATLTVTTVPVASLSVSPASARVAVGGAVPLTAIPKDSSGNVLFGKVITWSTSNPQVASVSSSGALAVGVGSATITATSEGKSATATITVIAAVVHAGYYAATTGTSTGTGTIGNPWDVRTALNGSNTAVHPGDTIWLRGGSYRGPFTSNLTGTAAAPIVVRQYPGERALIDGAGSLQDTWVGSGSYTYFWGFEVTNTDPTRCCSSSSSFRADQVANSGAHNKYINLIVHDGGVGYYTGTAYPDVEIYGSIVYNIGYQGPDRGHGHAFYLKNDLGPVVARDNVAFNEYGYGFHVYSNAGSGLLNNIQLVGNVAFNSGTLSSNSTTANLGILGQPAANGITVQNNLTYYSPSAGGIGIALGTHGLLNGTLTASGNYVVGGVGGVGGVAGDPAVFFGDWTTASFSGNTVSGPGVVVTFDAATTAGITWGSNQYYRDPSAKAWGFAGTTYGFSAWQTLSGLGATDLAQAAAPSAPWVFVRPNAYEPGRAHIVVYNWSLQASIAVDVSAVLKPGDTYEVHNVQDLVGPAVASGAYLGGPITLPQSAAAGPVPIGLSSSPAPVTGPAFGVFLLTRALP
jgi:hypothetical protein